MGNNEGDPCLEAMRLRAWALPVLAGRPATAPPPLSAAGWAIFLAAERCAAPLRRLLDQAGLEVPPALRHAADLEVRHSLSVQALLRYADRALDRVGADGVALKGAVPLLTGSEPLDIQDLDLLVPPERAREVADALAAQGLTVGKDADADLPVDAPGGWEVAVRATPGTVPVEVHVAAPFLPGGADPWHRPVRTALPRILRPAPEVHLLHVLVHSTVHHLERRGCLRDLLLARSAFAECDEGQRAWVARQAADHEQSAALLRVLGTVEALHRGGDVADAFRKEAALRYLFAGRGRRGASDRQWQWLVPAAYALADPGPEYRRLWWGRARSAWGEGGGRLAGRFPRTGRVARFAWRGAWLAGVTPVAWRLARAAGRLVARA